MIKSLFIIKLIYKENDDFLFTDRYHLFNRKSSVVPCGFFKSLFILYLPFFSSSIFSWSYLIVFAFHRRIKKPYFYVDGEKEQIIAVSIWFYRWVVLIDFFSERKSKFLWFFGHFFMRKNGAISLIKSFICCIIWNDFVQQHVQLKWFLWKMVVL